MVNPFKGEVLLDDGEGRKFKFVFGMWAQSVLEEKSGESWATFWGRAKDWTATDILTLFSAGLARHHEDMERREVADLMDRLGPTRCSEIVNEAVTKAMPSVTPSSTPPQEDAKGNVRPPGPKRRAAQATTM